ncbi:hypothetical protein HMN09_00451000 [Mycena chlorophos]|uniref:F-box domain-containing protein n=1 Tax=Mycena chlorophos TaxID=658473 RepID=A0A8H6WGU4_MYCCL|nr:hypothetical protein HMN09_00451000 [Mycena chlorophos]
MGSTVPWNADVLDIIISHLPSRDIASLALTNSYMMACASPHLYSTLAFTFSMAREYPALKTPFSTVCAHPELAVHVRHVDISTIPFAGARFSAVFLREADEALAICDNLVSFRCSANAVIAFIPVLRDKRWLRSMRVNVDTYPHIRCAELLDLPLLSDLALDWMPVHVSHMLPVWTIILGETLTSLTIFMSASMNEDLLKSALQQLPGLLELHVVGCPQLYHDAVLGLTHLTPRLKRLSVSAKFDLAGGADTPLSLPNLQHLSIDVRLTSAPIGMSSELSAMAVATLVGRIADLPQPPHLKSLRIRAPSHSSIHFILLNQLASSFSSVSLEDVSFLDCSFDPKSLSAFAKYCATSVSLEALEIALPMRDLVGFARALSSSRSLRVLRIQHQMVAPDAIRYLLKSVPALQEIWTKNGIWTARSGDRVAFEPTVIDSHDGLDKYWFAR